MQRRQNVIVVLLLFSILPLMSCGSLGKQGVKSSPTEQDWSEFEESPEVASQGTTGRMDGVEYYINQELVKSGVVASHGRGKVARRFPELESIFDSPDASWKPGSKFDIPVVHNENVTRWINTFTGPLRKNFARWLRRASHYAPLMQGILREYGLPEDLIYLAMIESGFNMQAYSRAHAAGPWQFIRSTGKLYGLDSKDVVDERRDMLKATRAAASHLRDLHNLYDNWYLAFAAYNAGAGKVNRAIKGAGTKDYWQLAAKRSRLLRQETKDYVPKILAAAIISKNYRKYGFSTQLFEKPLNFDLVTVPDATDVQVLAYCARTDVKEIETLNPSLVLGVTPPNRRYSVFIPAGRTKIFKKNYEKIPERNRSQFDFYRVKGRKESLNTVANHFKVPAHNLAKVNLLSARSKITSGQLLVIPKKAKRRLDHLIDDRAEPSVLVASATTDNLSDLLVEKADSKAVMMAEANRELNLPIVPLEEEPEALSVVEAQVLAADNPVTHRVRRGDTLSLIGKQYGVSVASLKAWNHLQHANRLKAGQTLKLSSPTPGLDYAPLASQVPLAAPVKTYATYKVRYGDTLFAIAKKNNMPLSTLKSINNLADKTQIQAGQVLRVGATPSLANNQVHAPQNIKAIIAPQPASDRLIIHAVRKGETLWDLSRKYRVSIADLKRWNRLHSTTLTPNQKIKIYADASGAAKKIAMK